jgi:hypothetical protein
MWVTSDKFLSSVGTDLFHGTTNLQTWIVINYIIIDRDNFKMNKMGCEAFGWLEWIIWIFLRVGQKFYPLIVLDVLFILCILNLVRWPRILDDFDTKFLKFWNFQGLGGKG